MEVGKKLCACLPGSEISCENQTAYNAIDRTRAHTDTAGRYCLEHERHPAWVGELLPLSQFQCHIGKGENARRRALAHTPDEAPQDQGSRDRPWPFPEPAALYALWVIQSSDNGGLEISACLGVKNIGKPCAGKPHARFDEGGQAKGCSLLYPLTLDIAVTFNLRR